MKNQESFSEQAGDIATGSKRRAKNSTKPVDQQNEAGFNRHQQPLGNIRHCGVQRGLLGGPVKKSPSLRFASGQCVRTNPAHGVAKATSASESPVRGKAKQVHML
jgi:hypothetical protein